MPKVALSDALLRSLPTPEAGQLDYWDSGLSSFGVRVSQGGSKTFILNVSNSRRTIGRYPVLSLSEARTEAKRMLAEKTLGKLRPQALTFQAARKLFVDEKRNARRENTVSDYEYYLGRFFDFQGQLADVSHGEIVRRLDRIKTAAMYNHALASARGFFNWCHKRRYISDNPVTGISGRRTKTRERVLTDEELKRIWLACEDDTSAMPASFRRIVKLLMLTGQRRSEVAALQGEFFADNRCTLPSELCKNGNEHTFPLGSMASEVVGNAAPGLLFPARGRDTPFNGWSKSKAILDEASATADWTLHDLRRTFATNQAKLGTPIHVVEKLLNHITGTTGGLVGIYQRHAYWDEQVAAIKAWEAHLQALFSIP
jgi:integrase